MLTRDYLTGESICAVCGARTNNDNCCKTAPYIPYDEFRQQYFTGCSDNPKDGEAYVPHAIAREFYDDYLHSNYASLQDYIDATTTYGV